MRKNNILNNGIPVSVSLNPALESEKFTPRREHDKKRILMISGVAFFVAVIACCIARLLLYLIDLFTNLAFRGTLSVTYFNPAHHDLGIWVIGIPVLGGGVVGLMALYGSKAIRGHGIPEAMEQILTNQSKINPAIVYLKPLSSAISIGTGGPFGAEGPIIATGGAFGSTIGQLLKISDNERKILLASGATAGMAAIFGSPAAAMFLAIELLLFEFSPRSLIPVSIACITGAAGHHLLFGGEAVFAMQDVFTPGTVPLLIYAGLGIIIGVLSAAISRAVYLIEDGFEKFPVHWAWWPAIGGIAVGFVGYLAPATLGVGYENIRGLLSGNLPLQMVVALCLLKFISWAVALGSGTSGGTLAPLLTIGGAAGVLLGQALLYLFPGAGITLPLTAVIGMSAMFAGASRALLTSVIFAFETTHQSNVLLPVLASCIPSYFVSFFLMQNSIMTEKIARRGVRTPHTYEQDLLEKITVQQVMNQDETVLSEENNIRQVREWLNKESGPVSNYFVVISREGEYRGIVNSFRLLAGNGSADHPVGSLVESKSAWLAAGDSLRMAAETMAKENVDVLPVVSEKNRNEVVGILSYRDIISAYKQDMERRENKQVHISLRRRGLKILLRGQQFFSSDKEK